MQRIRVSVMAAVTAAVALAGCGSGSHSSGNATSKAAADTVSAKHDSAAAAALPPSVRHAGVLSVGINGIFPPMEYVRAGSTQLIGFDVDFANALGKELGIRVRFDNQQFDQLINSVKTGRDEVIISGLSDLASREKILNFIDYFNTGTQAFVTKQKASSITSLSALCGQTMAMSASTSYVTDMQNWSKSHCGAKSIKILGVDSEPTARLQLQQGRAVASATAPENLAYLNRQTPGAFTPVGPILHQSPYGIALTKKETGLQKALLLGVKAMFADGTYKAILNKWQLTRDGLARPLVNSPNA